MSENNMEKNGVAMKSKLLVGLVACAFVAITSGIVLYKIFPLLKSWNVLPGWARIAAISFILASVAGLGISFFLARVGLKVK